MAAIRAARPVINATTVTSETRVWRRSGDTKRLLALKAHPIDDDAFRLLAIPFGGPIPKADAPKGADLDGEWFSERTDIKADWFPFRPVDWHHRNDRTMGGTIFGKAVLDNEPEEDGWWVTVWLKHGERRLDLVRKLASKGAELFGSSEAVPSLVQKARTGEILVWPYIRQAISTSPQNPLSIIRPLKATVDDLATEGESPTSAFFDDLEQLLGSLTSDPVSSLASDDTAKAGRVLATRNEARLIEARNVLGNSATDPREWKRALGLLNDVLDELSRYTQQETST